MTTGSSKSKAAVTTTAQAEKEVVKMIAIAQTNDQGRIPFRWKEMKDPRGTAHRTLQLILQKKKPGQDRLECARLAISAKARKLPDLHYVKTIEYEEEGCDKIYQIDIFTGKELSGDNVRISNNVKKIVYLSPTEAKDHRRVTGLNKACLNAAYP